MTTPFEMEQLNQAQVCGFAQWCPKPSLHPRKTRALSHPEVIWISATALRFPPRSCHFPIPKGNRSSGTNSNTNSVDCP